MTTYHLSATPKTKKQVQEAQLQYMSPVNCPNSESANYYENDQS